MTKGKRLILAVIVAITLAYLAIAFINIELNPFRWTAEIRSVFCVLALLASWLLGGLPYIIFKAK